MLVFLCEEGLNGRKTKEGLLGLSLLPSLQEGETLSKLLTPLLMRHSMSLNDRVDQEEYAGDN